MSTGANIIGYCRVCGRALEAGQATAAEGTLYCSEHAPLRAADLPPAAPQPASPYTGASPYTAPPYHATAVAAKGDPNASPGLAFILGMIPGVGAVYNGQYAKALVHVVIVGAIISILANGAAHGFEPLFGILLPCFWFYMCFEAYHTAKKRRDGVVVDEFSGLVHRNGPPARFPAARR